MNHFIIDSSELNSNISRGEVVDHHTFMDYSNTGSKILISFLEKENKENNLIRTNKKSVNSSVSIASAITAYARIFMSYFAKLIDTSFKRCIYFVLNIKE